MYHYYTNLLAKHLDCCLQGQGLWVQILKECFSNTYFSNTYFLMCWNCLLNLDVSIPWLCWVWFAKFRFLLWMLRSQWGLNVQTAVSSIPRTLNYLQPDLVHWHKVTSSSWSDLKVNVITRVLSLQNDFCASEIFWTSKYLGVSLSGRMFSLLCTHTYTHTHREGKLSQTAFCCCWKPT